MSYTEKHIGRVKILTKTTSDTLAYLEKNPVEGITYDLKDGKIVNWDCDNEKYLFTKNYKNGEFYLLKFVYHRKLDEYEDIDYKQYNDDGTISFITEFYNGGCGFDEALGDLLEYELSS